MIIAHNKDYETFTQLLSKSVSQLEKDSSTRPKYYLNRGGVDFEKDVYSFVNNNAKNTIFEGSIELISGQKFPDIVAYVNKNKAYGLEVKTTKSNKWKTIGSSIFEGTRVDNTQNIHLLFGKLSSPIEFKCKKYEECLYDVAITHSPRYLIDMDIMEHESIFKKVGIEYNQLRKLNNPFKPIKRFIRKTLKEGEDLWWIGNDENTIDLSIRHWSNLYSKQKDELSALALAYFPVLLSKNPQKYLRLSTWLVSRFGVVNHALRDTFTTGGQIKIQGVMFPQIFKYIVGDLNNIITNVNEIQEDDVSYYWEIDVSISNKTDMWKQQCLLHCKNSLNENQLNIIKQLLL